MHKMMLPFVVMFTCFATACGPQTRLVEWEEEVALNGNETLWVKRSMSYVRATEPGNPLQAGWRRTAASISFSWRGEAYFYPANAMALAVGPSGDVFAIRPITRQDVYERAVPCRTPSYVMFNLRDKTLVPSPVASWAIGHKRNLLLTVHADDIPPPHVTAAVRQARDAQNVAMQDAATATVDAAYVAAFCRGKG